MFHEFSSTSQKTGFAPDLITADKHEIIVNEGKMTSSSLFKSKHFNATSNAALPLDNAIPYFLEKWLENFFSNSLTVGLFPDIFFLLRVFNTAILSFRPTEGSKTGINF